MAFHEIRFPLAISRGSIGGPERRTEIVTLNSGREVRNSPWADSRRRFDAGYGIKSLDDIAEIIAFFEARSGRLHGFRYRDWSDWKSCVSSHTPAATDQVIGTGNGTATVFYLQKTYQSGPAAWVRPIQKPVAGTILAAVNGTPAAVTADVTNGSITFATPPANGAQVTAGFQFDVPVRFDTDRLEIALTHVEAGDIPRIPIVEIKP